MGETYLDDETLASDGGEETVELHKPLHANVVGRIEASDGGSDLEVSISGARGFFDDGKGAFGTPNPSPSIDIDASGEDQLFRLGDVDGYCDVMVTVTNLDTSDATVTLYLDGYDPYASPY